MTAPTAATFALDFEVRGSGDPILFISGTNDDRNGWAANVPAFEEGYRCITFDNRDVGTSPRADTLYTIEDMARDATGVLDAAGIDRAHVVGHSMGGLIAQEVAISAPERVRSLVLVDTFPEADPYIRGATTGWQVNARNLTSIDFARASMFFWVGETMINAEGPEALAEVIAPLIEAQGVEAFCRQIDAVLAYSSAARLDRIMAPTLVVWGVEDKIALEYHQRALLDRIAGAKYVRIEGAGHSPTFEQPEAFNQAVNDFLALVA
ncbi:MAG: alpha/beta fold hydrolase [Tepidiformaceae bacterium]